MGKMIEKLKWHDATKVQPDHKDTVLMWIRGSKPFSHPGWTIGWFENGDWFENESGRRTIWVVTHWAVPEGPE